MKEEKKSRRNHEKSLESITEIINLTEELLLNEQDKECKDRYKQVIRFLKVAYGELRTIKNYREMKQSETLIYNPETGKLLLATNQQMIKLAIMKGELEDEQSIISETYRGTRRSDNDDETATTSGDREQQRLREIANFCQYNVLRKTLLNLLPPDTNRTSL